jgi:hypothetical protein
MNEIDNLNLNQFQSEVFYQYTILRDMQEPSPFVKETSKRFDGQKKQTFWNSILWKPIFSVMAHIEKKALQKYHSKPDYLEYKKQSNLIINDPKIKQKLCSLLNKEDMSDLMDEEKAIKTIKIITSELLRKDLPENFYVESDATLFAFISFDILCMGIQNYCE